MRTALLLDVPKTHMSRYQRVTAFKERNDIWTHRADIPIEDEPWSVLLLHRARKALAGYLDHDDPDDPISLIVGYCRLLEESGLLVTGLSEREAIKTLCNQNKIPCNL